jgi:hypothetical protein
VPRALAALALALAGLASGCCSDPWSAYPESAAPDDQYTTGSGTHGYDVYVWSCLKGQRVVVAQFSSEMSCQAPRREAAPCGGTTAIEKQLASEPRSPARPGRDWR